MSRGIGLFIGMMCLALAPSALAQRSCEIQCRGIGPFVGCVEPLDGNILFKARVSKVTAACPNWPPSSSGSPQVLSVDVPDAPQFGLPSKILVDVGPCKRWAGKIGDVIDIAVKEPHSPATSSYTLACR